MTSGAELLTSIKGSGGAVLSLTYAIYATLIHTSLNGQPVVEPDAVSIDLTRITTI